MSDRGSGSSQINYFILHEKVMEIVGELRNENECTVFEVSFFGVLRSLTNDIVLPLKSTICGID